MTDTTSTTSRSWASTWWLIVTAAGTVSTDDFSTGWDDSPPAVSTHTHTRINQSINQSTTTSQLKLSNQLVYHTHTTIQGSYWSCIVKFPDFSLSFQVMEWQFPWLYWKNNPTAQMLEMVHYILRFIITMIHVIHGAILSAARRSGGAL